MKRLLQNVSIVFALLLVGQSALADDVTWNGDCVIAQSSNDTTLTIGGIELTVVNNFQNVKDYVSPNAFLHWNGKSTKKLRYASFTAPSPGTVTVTYKSNNGDANDRIVAFGKSVINNTDLEALLNTDGVYAAGYTKGFDPQVITGNVEAGNVYIYNANGGCSVSSIVFTPSTSVTNYTVTLHPNGGSVSSSVWTANEDSYTRTSTGSSIVLPSSSDITMQGYSFDGWYSNSSLTGDPVTRTGNMSSNAEYWAKWTENICTLNETDEVFPDFYQLVRYKVTVNRTLIANQWNTLCLPFDISGTKAASFGIIMRMTSIDENTVNFVKSSSIKHGQMYIVKPTESISSFTVTNVTLNIPDTKNFDDFSVYSPMFMTKISEEQGITKYVLSNDKFYTVDIQDLEMKAFRWYITDNTGNSSAKKGLMLNFDGLATDISTLDLDTAKSCNGKFLENGRIVIKNGGKTFNVAGQRMK